MTMQGAIVAEGVSGPAAPDAARWLRRVLAALLDGAVLGAIAFVSGSDTRGAALSLTPFIWSAGPVINGWIIATFWVLVALQAYTGTTPGKLVMGIAVLDSGTGRPLGLWRTVLRLLAHLLDSIFLIGYLRPLWNAERRTFADSLIGSDALVVPYAGQRRRLLPPAVVVTMVALVLGNGIQIAGTPIVTECPVTATGEGTPTLTGATSYWTPVAQPVTRLWITRDVPVLDGGRFTLTWVTADLELSEADGTVRVQVLDDTGRSHGTTLDAAAGEATIMLGTAAPQAFSLEQVIDGTVVARCEVTAP